MNPGADGVEDQSTPAHRATVDQCLADPSRYTARELEFLRSIRGASRLTDGQERWLENLADPIDFDKINAAALAVLPSLLRRWLPSGTLHGKEWVALNPTRGDTSAGSFRINISCGKWSDFATRDRGGDPVSLAAYLHHGGDQFAAARSLRGMLGG